MAIRFTNNATGTLASALSSVATSLTLGSGQGARFPSTAGGNSFKLTITSSTAREIVLVTARAGDVCTITRAQEGTSAVSFAAGDAVWNFLTAGELNDIVDSIAALASGAVAALDDLSDVDAAAPSDGNILRFNNGTGNWEPAVPSAVAGATYNDNADRSEYTGSFASVSDDFNGVSLAAMWSAINAGGSSTNAVANGRLAIKRLAADTTDNMRGVVMAVPAGSWLFETHISLISTASTGYHVGGIYARRGGGTAPNVANTTTDKFAGLGIGGTGGPWGIGGLSGSGTNVGTSGGFFTQRGNEKSAYFRIEYDGTNLNYYVSVDGTTWLLFVTVVAATQLGGAPDSLMLAVNNEEAHDVIASFDYFWRIA